MIDFPMTATSFQAASVIVYRVAIEEMGQTARVVIETKALDGLTLLAQGALETAEAREFLASMPTVEALMPPLDVGALGPLALTDRPTEME